MLSIKASGPKSKKLLQSWGTDAAGEKASTEHGKQAGVAENSTDKKFLHENYDPEEDAFYEKSEAFYDIPKKVGSGGNKSENLGAAERATVQKMSARINLDQLEAKTYVGHTANNGIIAGEKKANTSRAIGLCRDTRATIQSCLDPRTMQVLFTLFSNIFLRNTTNYLIGDGEAV